MKRSAGGRKRRQGFTLIELLVVVSIIGLLTAILVPSILVAMKKARYAHAMTQISSIEGAIKSYFNEYGRMPVAAGQMGGTDKLLSDQEQAYCVATLIGLETNQNRRQIVFLDLAPESFGVKSLTEMNQLLSSGEPYRDPWGTPYGVALDLNFDDKIKDVIADSPSIPAKVLVFSGGPATNLVSPPLKTW